MNSTHTLSPRRGVPLGLVIAGIVGVQILVTAIFAWRLFPGLL